MENNYLIYLAVIGIVYIVYWVTKTVVFNRRRAASGSWPVTTGKVLNKNLRRRGQSYSYFAEITYVYSVGGNEVEKTISLEGGTYSAAENVLNGVGVTLDVLYNPQNPKDHITKLEMYQSGL